MNAVTGLRLMTLMIMMLRMVTRMMIMTCMMMMNMLERQNFPHWVELTEKLVKDAHLEWFNAWKRTYHNIQEFVWQDVYDSVFLETEGSFPSCQCTACGQVIDIDNTESDLTVVRDHIFLNGRSMAGNVCIPVKHTTNLMSFFFVPCGPQVESKLLQLAGSWA